LRAQHLPSSPGSEAVHDDVKQAGRSCGPAVVRLDSPQEADEQEQFFRLDVVAYRNEPLRRGQGRAPQHGASFITGVELFADGGMAQTG
jgi:hypothetical protein